jgi:hypothetical protein
MLPLLVVLFLISYVLLTTLVVLQDRTIDSQRGLIHLLFKDNLQLVATKIGLHKNPMPRANQNSAQCSVPIKTPSAQVQSTQVPAVQTPSVQVPATQTPSTQVPVIQAKPEASAKAGQKSRKSQKALPSRPPVEVTDPSDMRRVSISI